MIKILFVIETLGCGGAEKVLVNLVNNMDHSKFDITVMTLFKDGVNAARLSDKVTYVSRKKFCFKGMSHLFKFIPSKLLYRYYVGKEKYDLVAAYMTGVPTKIVEGCPYRKIAWLHADFQKKNIPSIKIIGNDSRIAECYKKFDAIAGVSQFIIDSFSKRIGINDNLHLVYNVNESDVIQNNSKEEAEFVFDAGNDVEKYPVIASVGKLESIKGYARLLKIAKRLKDDGYMFRLCILGEGIERKKLEEYISKNGLESTVYLLGFQNNPYKYLSKSDLFVCSSYSEGLSTATTEALLLGLPIVSTDVSGAKEILGENNEWGIVTGLDDESLYEGIKKMLSSEELREHYRAAARERAPFFDTKAAVKQAEDLFFEVMK